MKDQQSLTESIEVQSEAGTTATSFVDELVKLASSKIRIEKVTVSVACNRSTVGKQSNNYFQSVTLHTLDTYGLLDGASPDKEESIRKAIATALKSRVESSFKFAKQCIKDQMTTDNVPLVNI